MSKLVGSLAAGIKLAVFDFDGVFTDNTVWTFVNGQEAVLARKLNVDFKNGLGDYNKHL